jgi:hypothetical protein
MKPFASSPPIPSEPRRLVVAPSPSHPRLPSAVLDVECGMDEEVEWLWTLTDAGNYVSGYRIVTRCEDAPAG